MTNNEEFNILATETSGEVQLAQPTTTSSQEELLRIIEDNKESIDWSMSMYSLDEFKAGIPLLGDYNDLVKTIYKKPIHFSDIDGDNEYTIDNTNVKRVYVDQVESNNTYLYYVELTDEIVEITKEVYDKLAKAYPYAV